MTDLDAEWKRIQKKTFTRWCNEHLRHQGMMVEDLSLDLGDGVKLITLLQVLSHKSIGKYNKKPRVRAQKLENVQLALDFIKMERIKLVNIGKCLWFRGKKWESTHLSVFVLLFLQVPPTSLIATLNSF